MTCALRGGRTAAGRSVRLVVLPLAGIIPTHNGDAGPASLGVSNGGGGSGPVALDGGSGAAYVLRALAMASMNCAGTSRAFAMATACAFASRAATFITAAPFPPRDAAGLERLRPALFALAWRAAVAMLFTRFASVALAVACS